jgi:sensor domain CHASE-containing protein
MSHLSVNEINKLVERIDTRSESIVYWDDFLRFLEHEGEMRDMINDMRIN